MKRQRSSINVFAAHCSAKTILIKVIIYSIAPAGSFLHYLEHYLKHGHWFHSNLHRSPCYQTQNMLNKSTIYSSFNNICLKIHCQAVLGNRFSGKYYINYWPEIYIHSPWAWMAWSFWAFNCFSGFFLFQGGTIIQHMSLMTLKGKNWEHKFEFFWIFIFKIVKIIHISSL